MNIWNNRTWKPMLLKEIKKPFNDKNYIFELKFDGIRGVIYASKSGIQIMSRNNQDLTKYFPELESIKDLVKKDTIFDGELVSFENSTPSFKNIMKRIRLKNEFKIKQEATINPIVFVAFDILYLNKDLTNEPLTKRKEYLNKFEDTDYFIKTKVIDDDGIKLFNTVKKLNLEGIVAKKKDGLYHINRRTDDFIKIKNINIDDFYVGGYEEKKNGIISLILGEYENNKLNYVGKVAISKNTDIYQDIINSKKSNNYFINFFEDVNYIKPTIKCRIEYLEKTNNNHLRHPRYKGD